MTSTEPRIDPALAALADAILIPPFSGTTPPPWIRRALEQGLAGVTLFGPNVFGDTAALTGALRAAAAVEPVIAIDEEGGDVTRVAYAAGSPYPGNAALGEADDVALTRDVYAAIGGDLARLGINTNLAPCADVLAPGGSSVVGTRSFGSDPGLVARHVTAAVAGLQGAGVAACAKHFPGHGRTAADSHLSLATVPGTLAELRLRDLPPFTAAIAAGAKAIMPGHLRVPELTGDLPATFSSAAVTGLLRRELGFGGVVISDALEMQAASAALGIPAAAVFAVIAGVDLVCLGRDTDEAMYYAVRTALAEAVASGTLASARLEEAAGRVAGLRAWLADARHAEADQAEADQADARQAEAGQGGVPHGSAGGTSDGVPDGSSDGVGLVAARRALRRSGPVPTALANPLVVEVEPEENIAAGRFTWGFAAWADVLRVDPTGDGAAAGHGAAADDGAAVRDGAAASDAAGTGAIATAEAIVATAAGRPLVLAVRGAIESLGLVSDLLAARPDTVVVEMGIPVWTPQPGTAYLATYGASRVCAQAAAEALGLVRPALRRRVAAAEADQRVARLGHVGHACHRGDDQQMVARRHPSGDRALQGGQPAQRDQRPGVAAACMRHSVEDEPRTRPSGGRELPGQQLLRRAEQRQREPRGGQRRAAQHLGRVRVRDQRHRDHGRIERERHKRAHRRPDVVAVIRDCEQRDPRGPGRQR
jgi:beta-N-acetylhexosaminidase